MSDEQLLDGYTEDELNAILESDDPDQIEAMLAGKKTEQDKPTVDADDAADEETDADTESDPEKKQGEESATPGAEGDQEKGDDKGDKPYIESKSGGNKIPYGVLEAARERERKALEQLSEAQEKLSKLESSSKTMSAYLEKNGIDLSALERGETLDDEQLAALEELDPAVAKLARITMALYERQDQIANQVSEAQSAALNPVELAIRENDDLKAWRKSDPDRWEMAQQQDDLLQKHPEFKNASLEDRFAEAVRLTKLEFGDPVPQKQSNQQNRETAEQIAERKIAEAKKQTVPRSLTDLGATPTTERSKLEVIGDLSDDALIDAMADMSSDAIDKLLANG